jgi:hypothetical protein
MKIILKQGTFNFVIDFFEYFISKTRFYEKLQKGFLSSGSKS